MANDELITVTIAVRVHDKKAFVRAAQKRAINDGIAKTMREAREYGYNTHDLPACAQMLFDPGISPDGCEILESSASNE